MRLLVLGGTVFLGREVARQASAAGHDGPRSLPLWTPMPETAGMLTRDVGPAFAAGLRVRPVAETAAATLAWLRDLPAPPGAAGLTAAQEAALLRAWDERDPA